MKKTRNSFFIYIYIYREREREREREKTIINLHFTIKIYIINKKHVYNLQEQ